MKQHLTLSLLTTALLTACGGVYNEHAGSRSAGPKADNPGASAGYAEHGFQD